MSTAAAPARLAHQPALDGLRAAAVVMVLLFHGGVPWMRGGYFGVSVFFTLSGFLITMLLANEFASSQRIAAGTFYARRARRLLPASTVCLAIVSIMASRDVWRGASHIRRDVLGGVFQVANWVQLGSGASYTDLQSKSAGLRSPLDHYWSLAVEEQFYWIWPLAFWGLARAARRRGWSMTRVLAVLTVVFAAAAPAIAVLWGRDAAYWATPARAAEILIGALVAMAVREERIAARAWMAPVGLAAVGVLAVVLPAAGGPAYHGAFPLLAVASACLLLGLQRGGIVRSALSWRPFVALGAISYGVYLFHFPVFVYLSAVRLGRGGWMLLTLRIVVTLVIATVSYWLIERPIRRATWTSARTAMHASVAVALVLVAVVFVPNRSATYWMASKQVIAAAAIPSDGSVPGVLVTQSPASTLPTTTAAARVSTTAAPVLDVSSPATTSVQSSLPETTVAVSTDPTLPTLNRPVRIVVVGDSTALATGAGLAYWAALNPTIAKVTLVATAGCGFVRAGVVPTDAGVPFTKLCDDKLDNALPVALADLHPDVVMLMSTLRDCEPRLFDGADTTVVPTDPRYALRVRIDYDAITAMILNSSTARVVWIRPPAIDPLWMGMVAPDNVPESHAVVEGVMRDVAAEHPDRVQVLDFAAWFAATDLQTDHSARPDGIHLTPAAALDVANRWLGRQLVIAAVAGQGG